MADLSSLIRLHKYELDEKQREIGELYEQLNELEVARASIIKRREDEIKAAAKDPELVSYTMSGFLEKSKVYEENLNKQIFIKQHEVETVREDMMNCFAELKKYELTQTERERIEAQEIKLKEGRMFDDIAISGFVRGDD